MKVVAFNGSPRRTGNTSRLINVVLDELRSEALTRNSISSERSPYMAALRVINASRTRTRMLDEERQR